MSESCSHSLSEQKMEDSGMRSWLPWLVWGLAAAYFFSDYFARVSPGVMSRELQLAFSVSAAGLGGLSAFFYYPYVAMQLPVGLLVDRYSIRNLLAIMSLLTACGCAMFGLASNLWIASVARMLIGFSAAFAFVGALRLAAMWFPPAKLGLIAGLTQALGMLGAAVGEAPVSYLVASVGWRATMLLMVLIFVILAGLIFKFVFEKTTVRAKRPVKTENSLGIIKSLKLTLANNQTKLAALYAGLIFAPTAVIGEFWGPAYLEYGHHIGTHAAAFANGLIFIGWGIGGPLFGWLSDRIERRKPLLYFSGIAGLMLMSLILFMPHFTLWQLYTLFFLYGLTNYGVSIAYAVVTEVSNKKVLGASIAFANMSSIIIGAIMQPLLGQLIDWHAGFASQDIANLHLLDFRFAFSILPFCSLLALVCAFFIKETYCSQETAL